MDSFQKMAPKKCRCKREGVIDEIDAAELVPGDIVILTDGDSIPADLRLVEANEVKVDNSALTGESEAVERST